MKRFNVLVKVIALSFPLFLGACTQDEAPVSEPVKVEKPAEVPPASVELQAVVHFEFDSDKLDAKAKEILNGFVEDYKAKGYNKEVLVEAHTDAVGTKKYNKALSKRRAASVKAYLVSKGLTTSPIKAKWYGETRLYNQTQERDAQNRRAKVTVQVKVQ